METILPLKGNFVKPRSFSELYDGQSTWGQGESSCGRPRWVTRSPASATVVSRSPVTTTVPARATGGSYFGFSGMEGTNRRLKEDTQAPIASALRVGSLAKLLGLEYVVSFDLRH